MKRIVLILVVASVGAFALRGVLLPPVARFLDVSSDCELPVQYAVPLPGDDNTRTLAAAALVRHGHAEQAAVLQCVASPRETDGAIPPSAEVMRRVLLARGIGEERIVGLSGKSASTYDDVRLISQLWEEAPNARIAIVSNRYHLRRARWSMRRVSPDRSRLVSYIAAPVEEFDESDWWLSEEGLSSVLSEYFKVGFYVVEYGSAGQQAVLVAPVLGVVLVFFAWIVRRGRRRRAVAAEAG